MVQLSIPDELLTLVGILLYNRNHYTADDLYAA